MDILQKASNNALPSAQIFDPVVPDGAPGDVAGIWNIKLKYLRGEGSQRFLLEQQENIVSGAHQGEIYNGNLSGKVQVNQVTFRSQMPVGGNEINYVFTGAVEGDTMRGTVTLGEYGQAEWSATKQKT